MRYFAFADREDHIRLIEDLAKASDALFIILTGIKRRAGAANSPDTALLEWDDITAEALADLDMDGRDRVIVSALEQKRFAPLIEFLKKMDSAPPVLAMMETEGKFPSAGALNISSVDLTEATGNILRREWRLIEIKRRAGELYNLLKDAGKIAILTQNDPDPDGIACGLGLQALLGRNRTTAPILTLGNVTRNENLAMIRLLKTTVRAVEPEDLREFDRIVTVDVQPHYFGPDPGFTVDAVIDHHPPGNHSEAAFSDVNIHYGATSTMVHEYLSALGVKITRRLATALLYGIMTDTMRLERGASSRDFEAFDALWPTADKDMISNMARPRLNAEELGYFVRAIKRRRLMGDFLFLWLGRIKRDDIIPRLADFSLQIGEASFTATCGVFRGELIVSFRSMDAERNAGAYASALFSKWGSAGGHHSMAKAVISLQAFKSSFGLTRLDEVREKVSRMIEDKI
ncbi:MAG: DHH family phosphoesterase [Nitrospinae bacterium]|nr:DHH family phosphoesterase [Nitrospinota bacterium]MBF0633435.1 DHH family phosphoesterase [Nitrospinota bacterium]